jgi:cyclophilin family peptidyl-prolyl cis-trans isomerase
LQSPEASVRTLAAAALSKLVGRPFKPPFIEGRSGGDAPSLSGATLVFTTDKGVFKVRLDTLETPRTSANMVALAERRFFDGLTFHRIVPGFVAQGGDPRGDGEGGPGYRIRCEIGHAPYTRGSVGMALSGRDTGGSQFFVTLSAQPHLDGRYTRFGEVVEGMDVVDRLDEGDVMRSVRVERP